MTTLGRHAHWVAAIFAIGASAGSTAFAQGAPCRVAGLDEQVRCGTVEVPENRAASGSRTISLRVVILPSRAPTGTPRHALFYVVGGPGLAATTLADLVATTHATTRATHDIVLVDQRGTGGSNALRCGLYGGVGDVATYLSHQFPVDSLRACAARLARGADLTQYTTANAADDLEAVRAWLDVPRIDLDASAYGTRVALEYLARYGPRLRSVVLQGAIPIDVSLARTSARDAQSALDRVLTDCAADPFCRTSFPALRRELSTLLARFDRGPLTVRVEHPRSKDTVTVALTRDVFADRLRIMLYSTRLSRRIPIVLHRAHEGDWTPFVALAYELSRVVFDQLDVGAHLSAACVEDMTPSPDTRGTFLGDYRLRMYRAACAVWPHARAPDTGGAVTSSVPVLLVTGALDPVTPPRFAEAVARGMPNARVLVAPGMAHAGADPCVEGIVAQFIGRGSLQGVDTGCVTAIKPPPFVTR
ncbi:MAG TPA: alpha/beta fold hydrolase [Gemmatimonadaceae bacterium]|nr:alpha/beta fold hydrolase [Gemmatimonadaceae bacterium]